MISTATLNAKKVLITFLWHTSHTPTVHYKVNATEVKVFLVEVFVLLVFFFCFSISLYLVCLSIRHPAQVVGRDVSFLSIGLGQPPVFVASQVRELQDADVLVLLQCQFLVAARFECIHSIKLPKDKQMLLGKNMKRWT